MSRCWYSTVCLNESASDRNSKFHHTLYYSKVDPSHKVAERCTLWHKIQIHLPLLQDSYCLENPPCTLNLHSYLICSSAIPCHNFALICTPMSQQRGTGIVPEPDILALCTCSGRSSLDNTTCRLHKICPTRSLELSDCVHTSQRTQGRLYRQLTTHPCRMHSQQEVG